jgi:hypothetical protein
MVSLISGMAKEDKTGQKLRKKDVGMAKVSLVIVFIFIICHSVKWIPNIYELSQVVSSSTPPKALFTRDILMHNIATKRYCDKNIFLSHGCLKAKVSSRQKK